MTRRFSPGPISEGLIDSLLDIARRAPSAGFSQGTHFVVLSGESLTSFWLITGAGEWFAGKAPGVLAAPLVVVPIGDESSYANRYAEADKSGHGLDDVSNWPLPFWLTDTAMAAQNLLLLLEEAGIGALLFGIFRNERAWLDSIGAPLSARPVGAIAIGYRAADDTASGSPTRRVRRRPNEVIHHGAWANPVTEVGADS